jgi:homoserine O-acetyltransferase
MADAGLERPTGRLGTSLTTGHKTYALGDVRLQSGAVLKNAQLAYATYRTLNSAADNAVLLPTFYTGTHLRNEPLFGPGRAIDPARHFVVSVNLFANSYSSSPSNTPGPQDGPRFPNVTLFDNVACQHRLLTEHLGVRRIALVLGWSMAAMQAYQWAAQYSSMVEAILPYGGAARCSPINHAFLDGPKAALQADAAWSGGNYSSSPEKGLRAFGRIYMAWAYSHDFFRDGLYRELGFATLEDFVVDWEEDHLKWDANDLLAKIWTWQHGDISDNPIYRGEFHRALHSIEARAIVMPCSSDMYFVPSDNEAEVAEMRRAELRVFESPWGHCVASPGRVPEFQRALDEAAAELLRG